VRAILATHIAHEGAKTLRQFLAHLLAALGALVVGCVLFPDVASRQVEQALLGIWGVCLAFVVGTALVEWRLHRHEARLLADNHGVPES
jgi:protein-S-isoprenylcysteine O-methyltransferase Ste14